MNILVIGSIENYFFNETVLAIRKLGFSPITFEEYYRNKVRPDFILCINDIRPVLPNSLDRIPLVSWIGERLSWLYLWDTLGGKLADLYFVTDKELVHEVKRDIPNIKIEWLPLASSKPRTKPIRGHQYALSFVGNTMDENVKEMEMDSSFFHLPLQSDDIVQIGKVAHELVIKDINSDIDSVKSILSLRDNRKYSHLRNDILNAYIGMVITREKRRYLLNKMAERSKLLMIPEDWTKYVRAGFVMRQIDYINVSEIYNNSRININISSMHLPSAFNSRPFDVPMSGGFLLTDYRKYTEELFDNNEIVTYASVEEALDKIDFYSERDALREKVVLNAQKRVMAEHTYSHRLKKIIDVVKRNML